MKEIETKSTDVLERNAEKNVKQMDLNQNNYSHPPVHVLHLLRDCLPGCDCRVNFEALIQQVRQLLPDTLVREH